MRVTARINQGFEFICCRWDNNGLKNSLKKGEGDLVIVMGIDILAQVTEKPTLRAGMTEARVIVPEIAANSEVGFETDVAPIDEETNRAVVNIKRYGTYGAVRVAWAAGLLVAKDGYLQGTMRPDAGDVLVPHGVPLKSLTIQVEAKLTTPEVFALHLSQTPITTAPGGARLTRGHRQVTLEPSGVVRFADGFTEVTGSELAGKVELSVERIYGSRDTIELGYKVGGGNATPGVDYITERTVAIMEPGQTRTSIVIILKQDSIPEHVEDMYVTLTSVQKYPLTSLTGISPRLSSSHVTSHVIIKESDDPYGLLSMDPEIVRVKEPSVVLLVVRRTGGSYGSISVVVRTVGGGESWTSQIAPAPLGTDTIGGVLAGHSGLRVARGGEDYDIIDTQIHFESGVMQQTVEVRVSQDDVAEPEEVFFVYLSRVTGGARIATGSKDGGKKGYSVVSIGANDMSNGMVGFAPDSLHYIVNEDTSPTFTLKLLRQRTYFGSIQVYWRAKLTASSTEFEDSKLSSQLLQTTGNVTCRRTEFCTFNVSLIDDQIPEEAWSFVVLLYNVTNDAVLNNQTTTATVDVESSDHVRGQVQFAPTSRVVNVDKNARTVRLQISRSKGKGYDVAVRYYSDQMAVDNTEVSGVQVYQAREGVDYRAATGEVVFGAHLESLKHIDIDLMWLEASDYRYPKQFYVRLHQPTNGLSVNPEGSEAVVRLVDRSEIPVWDAVSDISLPTDEAMMRQLNQIQTVLNKPLSAIELTLIHSVLDAILTEANSRKVPATIESGVFDVLCKLLDTTRDDATSEASHLLVAMEKFAYSLVTSDPCPSNSQMRSYHCINARVSAARWKLNNIRGFQYDGRKNDMFSVPLSITGTRATDNGCEDMHVIEYFSDHWFRQAPGQQLLNNKVISFGIKNMPSRYIDEPVKYSIHTSEGQVDPRKVRCVYYDVGSRTWTTNHMCQVTTSVSMHLGNHIDCSCNHLSNYAVQSKAVGWGMLGVPVWVYVACFIAMVCHAAVVIIHHICPDQHTFAASLHMHLCASCVLTQVCYVVVLYVSASDILTTSISHNNYRCIIMGVFLHYVFLSQFTWIMAQAINFWRLLILNDEHTDIRYISYFFIGWGFPAMIVGMFYLVTYVILKYAYDMPTQYIYGDVNGLGNVCFVTNVYAGVGGVILPVLFMLLVSAMVFVKAYQMYSQWCQYDDIYRSRYNNTEVRSLLCVWLLLVVTWLWGGLHMVYGHTWMLILFTITNILQGLYVLLMYTFLRHPALTHKIKYLVTPPSGKARTADFTTAPYPPSLKVSHASIVNDGWDHIQGPKLMTIQRTVAPSDSMFINLVSVIQDWDHIQGPKLMTIQRTVAPSDSMFINPNFTQFSPPQPPRASDFDELILALKNGADTGIASGTSTDDSQSDLSDKQSVITRTPIADTHL